MGDCQLEMLHLECVDHLIRFLHRPTERLFHKYVTIEVCCRHGEFVMAINPTWADGDDIGPQFGEHLSNVGEAFFGSGPAHRVRQPLLIQVGHSRDSESLGKSFPDGIEPMAEISLSGMSNDGNAIFLHTIRFLEMMADTKTLTGRA